MIDPGIFISLEGPEGCGKSTQAEILTARLIKQGFNSLLTREPGGTELGSFIRNMLLNEKLDITSKAEILLYAADRAQHVEEVIVPALQREQVVICDRYIDSSTAYQGYARGLGTDYIKKINEIAAGDVIPDLSIFYDIPVQEGLMRKRGCGFDRMENEEISFHEKVRKAYLEIAEGEPERVKVINAQKDIKSVEEETLKIVFGFLKGEKSNAR